MKFGSVCSGIGAPEVAWSSLGWSPQWFSEIAPFPSKVLAHHYPQVPNHGSLLGLSTRNVCSPVDVIVGGTPCQSFSIAGLRGGLADSRGNLALEFCRLVGALRPAWFVWENVPGVLSSSGGRDFGSILGAMAELGYGLAWRILDARYCGVPQRRRRVFVVGSLAGAAAAGAVLFEPESVRRHSPSRKEAREDVAGTLGGGSGGRGWAPDTDRMTFVPEHAPTLDASYGRLFGCDNQHIDSGAGLFALQRQATDEEALASLWLENDRRLGLDADEIRERTVCVTGQQTHALRSVGSDASEDGTGRGTPIVVNARQDPPTYGDNCGPLDTDGHTYAVNARQDPGVSDGFCGPLTTDGTTWAVQQSWRVRRLTPVECSRLQGFPDTYLGIPGASDSAKYAALGNSMAVPVMSFIGRRIGLVHGILAGGV